MARIERINQLMKREISQMIQRDLQDPRLAFVTITQVQVSRDLQHARVSYSVLNSVDQANIQSILDRVSGFIRKLVGQRIRMRYTPAIVFVYDKSLEYSDQIDKTLEDIRRNEPQ